MKIVAIVNPVSGRARAPRKWFELLRALGPGCLDVTTWFSKGPGHAEILGARARREGFERVVVVGGDGTLLEVVNGLWWEAAGQLPSIGLVPFGTACDYLLNLQTGRSLPEKLATATGRSTIPGDVGLLRLVGLDGTPVRRVFASVMGFGYDAQVIKFQRNLAWARGLKSAYAIGALLQLLRLRCHRLSGEIDGIGFRANSILFAAGIGRYYGGGMAITPQAAVNAGRFQLVWSEALSRLQVLRLLPKIYSGSHLLDPRVHWCYGRSVKLQADPPAYVQAEGELLGTTPVEVDVYPKGLLLAAKGINPASALHPKPFGGGSLDAVSKSNNGSKDKERASIG